MNPNTNATWNGGGWLPRLPRHPEQPTNINTAVPRNSAKDAVNTFHPDFLSNNWSKPAINSFI